MIFKNYTFVLIGITFLGLMFFTTCKKDKALTKKPVTGQVIDAVTKEPVPRAYVALLAGTGDILNPGYKITADTLTDANGYFTFPASIAGDEVEAAKKDYFDTPMHCTICSDYLKRAVIEIEPHAYLNLHCKNINKVYGYISFGGGLEFFGYNVDTIIKNIVISSLVTKGTYWLTRYDSNSKPIDSLISFYISPKRFDTISVNVSY
ncbi:MAG: carboxypeptidase regulatory-like domain-containing protein [Bacteroidia bacterium]|nr:carboxypeptidase regulatory-like domain-containing protein [Bacteroidia bacterium]